MSNIAIIPIKSDSKRIPMKMYKEFCGQALWEWVTEEALKCPMIDRVYISTSDEFFINYKLTQHLNILKRPKELNGDVELTEVIKHAATQVAKPGDNILQIQANKPLTKVHDLMECIKVFTQYNYDSLSTVQEINTAVVGGYKKSSRLEKANLVSQAICKIWKYETLMESKEKYAYSDINHCYRVIGKHHIEIDTMEDWNIALALKKAGY